jgi:hypothetical protein
MQGSRHSQLLDLIKGMLLTLIGDSHNLLRQVAAIMHVSKLIYLFGPTLLSELMTLYYMNAEQM